MPTTRAIGAIVDAGADHGAEPGPIDHQPKRNGDDRRHQHDHEAKERKVQPGHLHRASQMGRRGRLPGIARPQHEAHVADDEGKPERQQHLRQLLAGETAQQEALDQAADHGHGRGADEGGDPEVDAPAPAA